jgi:hypothetical protein
MKFKSRHKGLNPASTCFLDGTRRSLARVESTRTGRQTMSQVDPWGKAAECARAIERSTDPDEDPDFRPIQLGLPVEDESRPAVKRAAQFIQLLLLHAVLVHTDSVLSAE